MFEAPENARHADASREQHAIVILPVKVAPDGRLTPSGKPWVPREYLAPTDGKSDFLVGYLKDVAIIQRDLDASLLETWAGALRYCDDLCRELFARYGSEPRGLTRGPERINLDATRGEFTTALVQLCEDLLRHGGAPAGGRPWKASKANRGRRTVRGCRQRSARRYRASTRPRGSSDA